MYWPKLCFIYFQEPEPILEPIFLILTTQNQNQIIKILKVPTPVWNIIKITCVELYNKIICLPDLELKIVNK